MPSLAELMSGREKRAMSDAELAQQIAYLKKMAATGGFGVNSTGWPTQAQLGYGANSTGWPIAAPSTQEEAIYDAGQPAPYAVGQTRPPLAAPEDEIHDAGQPAPYAMAQTRPSQAMEQPERVVDDMPSDLPFGKAFNRASMRDLLTFDWRGKRYTTERADGKGPVPFVPPNDMLAQISARALPSEEGYPSRSAAGPIRPAPGVGMSLADLVTRQPQLPTLESLIRQPPPLPAIGHRSMEEAAPVDAVAPEVEIAAAPSLHRGMENAAPMPPRIEAPKFVQPTPMQRPPQQRSAPPPGLRMQNAAYMPDGKIDMETISQEEGVPYDIVQKFVGQESGGDPYAQGKATSKSSIHKGARAQGILQVMPGTFGDFDRPGESIKDPVDRARVGARILAQYYKDYKGDQRKMAIAYFSGPGNLTKDGQIINDHEDPNGMKTSDYVDELVNGRKNRITRLGKRVEKKARAAGIAESFFSGDLAYSRKNSKKVGNMRQMLMAPKE